VEQVAARLDDRFALLTGGSRTALPRHQTLRAMIDWSYDFLAEEECTLLRRLSVFTGGWTLEAAEALNGGTHTLELLAQLVGKSLVVKDEHEAETRYRMLETIRQYAHEKLVASGEYERARQRHLEYFAHLAQGLAEDDPRQEVASWQGRMVAETDNLRAALDWAARRGDAGAGEALINGAMDIWMAKGYVVEGRRWIETMLPASGPLSVSTRAKRSFWLGALALKTSDFKQARDQFAESSALAHRVGDERLIFIANMHLAFVTPDHAEALRIMREIITLAQRIGWKWAEADATMLMGRRLRISGNYDEAAEWLAHAGALRRELEDSGTVYYDALQLGLVAQGRGDTIRARELFEEGVTLTRQTEDTVGLAECLVELATASTHQGDYPQATSALRESISIFHREGDLYRTAQCLAVAARVAQGTGKPERAARLLGAAAALRRDFPPEFLWVEPALHEEYECCLPLTRAAMSEAAFATAYAEGQHMTPDQAVGLVLSDE
jgi:tetratricopeptide (TPR) repeat protein